MLERLHLVATRNVEQKQQGAGAGLAAWLLKALRAWRAGAAAERRQMRVVETLALGTKNKLVLVSCGGERFLVGTGPESVGTIVRVRGDAGALAAAREQV